MTFPIRRRIVGAVLLGAAALGPAAARADYLSSSELRRLFPGQFEAVWKDKINLTLDAAANGKLAGGTWIKSGTGRWALRGNSLCISFTGWTKTRCGPVRRSGGWYLSLIRPDGTARLKFRRR